jgi:predicted RNase H-like nuclease
LTLDAVGILATCRELLHGNQPNVIAIDMPVARSGIVGRRPADNAISRAFGSAKCGTHSPNPARPGLFGKNLHDSLRRAGFELRTADQVDIASLIEVYPHVALLGLMRCCARVPYKAAKTKKYWNSEGLVQRRKLLLGQWETIVGSLATSIDGIPPWITTAAPEKAVTALKANEDALDALICAWVGITYLQNAAIPLGDADSAIWVPTVSMRYAQTETC